MCRRRVLQARKRQKIPGLSDGTAISSVLPRFPPLPRSKQIRPAFFLAGADHLVPISDPLTFEVVDQYKYFQKFIEFIGFYMAIDSFLTGQLAKTS